MIIAAHISSSIGTTQAKHLFIVGVILTIVLILGIIYFKIEGYIVEKRFNKEVENFFRDKMNF